MKKVILFWSFVLAVNFSLKAEDMSLLRIDGKAVPMSEFARYYRQINRVHKGEAEMYFQHFLHYKLKVADALERRMDTLPDFRRQCESIQACILKDFFTDRQSVAACSHSWYEQQSKRLHFKDWLKIEILTFRLPQHHTVQEDKEAMQVMTRLYESLTRQGADPKEWWQLAADKRIVCENDGNGWTPENGLVQEIIEVQSQLEKGALSAPFYSPLGIHLVHLIDRKGHQEMEWDASVMNDYLLRLGRKSPLLKEALYEQWQDGTLQLPEEVNLHLQQVRDGLLAIYWDKAFLFKTLSSDARELEAFFQAHKKHYRWELPHFKGAVIHCANKKIASKIKKRLKKLPMDRWNDFLTQLEKENSDFHTESECGIFQIGKNRYVDRLAFKCGDFEPLHDLPYTFLVGKRLKKGPEEYRDVLAEVETDYRIQKEKELFEGLSSHFGVEINQDVLKTVNSCGNN